MVQAGSVAGWRAYVGCRTTVERNARGRGIVMYDVPPSGPWVKRHETRAGDNPSYLCMALDGRTLYTVHGDGASVSAFRINSIDGALAPLGQYGLPGRNPVHLSIAPDGRWMVVACFASGIVVSLPVHADGRLGEVVGQVALPGSPGPLTAHQKGSHPHQVMFDPSGRWLMVPDKGLDRVFTLELAETGRLRLVGTASFKPGSAPRHMVFAPQGRHCFVACELSSEVVACTFDGGSGALQQLQTLSTVPDGTPNNSAAGIVLDAAASRLYVSNRGHDSVAVFSVDAATGRLATEGWTGTGGRTPRFIALMPDGHGVIAANEDSDTIARLMPIQPTAIDGMAQPTSFLAHTGSPVCVVFTKEPS